MSDADDDSDEALMLAHAAGDASAFPRLYDRHERAVYRFFLRNGMAAHRADDLLQDTWLAVLQSSDRYVASARFTTWLYTVARRKLIDGWRQDRRHVLLHDAANDPDDEAGDGADDAIDRVAASDAVRPDVRAISRQQAEHFVSAVDALPDAQREAFLLHIDGELSMAQMAEVTGVGVETAKSRLRYAMRRVRSACADWLVAGPVDRPGAGDAA